jgi:hypothetical protein
MPVTYSIDEAAHLVTLHYTGDTTFDEFASTMREVFLDPRYRLGLRFLVDRRIADVPTTSYIQRGTAFLTAHRAELTGSRWAVVVSNTTAYGMARMGQTMGESDAVDAGVFTGIDEALAWLQR